MDERSDEETDPFQTDEDSDYVPDHSDKEQTANVYEHVTPAKTRQRKWRPKEWKDSVAKRLRTQGKEHTGRKNKVIRARELKEYVHTCRYDCNKNISDQQRRQLFTKFYDLSSYDLQTSFLSSCIKQSTPMRRNTASVSNKKYSTTISLMGKRVCKQFFLKTFDISVRRFQVVCKKTSDIGMTEPDKRGKKEPPNKIKQSSKNLVISHINMFPKYKSHYARKDNPNAKYLSGDLSVKKMYALFTEFCKEKQEEPVKESYYRYIFNTEFNLRFHQPYSDTCSRCDTLQNIIDHSKDKEAVQKSKSDLELHQRKAQKAIDAKKNDIVENKDSEDTAVICFDLQQALPTPLLTTSKVFYLRQLWTYNFCVFDLLTGTSHMFIWDETVASRGSQEVGSCLIKFIQSLPPRVTKIIAYSDSCGGQNKNKNISKLFTFIVQATNINEIHHKFFEPGHTYMECDRSFGLIEKKKRQVPQVYVPADWVAIIKGTSKKFVVYNMAQTDFFSFDPFHTIMNDPKKDNDNQPLKWRDIHWFLYSKNEKLSFKCKNTLNNDLECWRTCTMKAPQVGRPSFKLSILKPLNKASLKIKIAKYKNLLTLLDFIPPIHHEYYKNISHDAERTITKRSKIHQPGPSDLTEEAENAEHILLDSDDDE